MAKVITVFGATGNQGKAVAMALKHDGNFAVRAVTRDVYHPKIIELKSNGVDVFQCDLDDVESIRGPLNGAYGCFVVTYTDFADPNAMEREIQVGKNIADACVAAQIQHVVYSTQLHTARISGITARHMVAKAEIEDYLKEKNLTLTCLLVPCYYEHFLDFFKPQKVDTNTFEIVLPMGNTSLDLLHVGDMGHVVCAVLKDKNRYLSKTISMSGCKLTIKEIAAFLSRGLAPLRFGYKQVTLNQYGQLGSPWSKDFANMFDFILRVDQKYNVIATREIHPTLKSFNEWVCQNEAEIRTALCS
ncbi:hypothetical protein ScPMuIL_009880 [Solemya velum]